MGGPGRSGLRLFAYQDTVKIFLWHPRAWSNLSFLTSDRYQGPVMSKTPRKSESRTNNRGLSLKTDQTMD